MLIGKKSIDFSAKAVFSNEIKDISLSQYLGQYVVLFFYPADFTFVCPTELHAFQEKLDLFSQKNVQVLACSVDSVFSHLAWLNTSKSQGGIAGVQYGIISDLGGHITKAYGLLNEENMAYRGLFLIDKYQIVRSCMINDMPLGRNVEEVLRLVDALQHSEQFDEVCPANWNKSEKAIQPTLKSVSDYLSK